MRATAKVVRLILCLLALLLMVSAGEAKERVHEVARGHSLWGIAKRYGVSVEALRDRNDLGESDKIVPGQKLVIPDKNYKSKGKSKDSNRSEGAPKRAKGFIASKPGAGTQVQKSSHERGINPCNTKDPGSGIYTRWSRGITMGQFVMPERGGLTSGGGFDVMFHFHGHEAVRKEWVQVMNGAVLVGVTLGTGSGPYETTFRGTQAFKRLVASVEEAVAAKAGRKKAYARKIGVSGWSAGYGAVGQIINSEFGRQKIDSVVLLDGLHSGYQGASLNEAQLKPFINFARRASRRQRFMFVSHSSIIPPGYASTTETSNFLIFKVGGRPHKTRARQGDPMGLDLISRYTKGNFHVRGYAGNDTLDHCAHIGLFRDVLKVHIKRRWNSPRGRK
jgi:murein DD-endopeptidase MepM/ murein hydrolase activator NlpD